MVPTRAGAFPSVQWDTQPIHTTTTIRDIEHENLFVPLSHFCRTFRKVAEVSPNERQRGQRR
jgi:AraC-like DNA-binding protein